MGIETVLLPVGGALLIMLASFSGKFFTYRAFGGWIHAHLPYLASFAGGVFTITAWHLSEEALHGASWFGLLGGLCAGGAIIFTLTRLFSSEHHHHGHHHGHLHSRIDGRRVLISDALHNTGDGIILALAFTASTIAGFGAVLAILLHEVVQEISEFFVLKEAGYTNKQALMRNFAVSSTILLGIFVGLFLSSVEPLIALLSAVAAGGIIFVITGDLLPHALTCIRAHGKAHVHVGAALFGAALMFSVQTLLPHEEHVDELPTYATHSVESTVRAL